MATLNERIIRSSGTAPFVTQTYIDAVWAGVGSAIQTTVTPAQLEVFAKPLEQIAPGEHGAYCLAASAAMRELSKLPAQRAAAAVRSMYQ